MRTHTNFLSFKKYVAGLPVKNALMYKNNEVSKKFSAKNISNYF